MANSRHYKVDRNRAGEPCLHNLEFQQITRPPQADTRPLTIFNG